MAYDLIINGKRQTWRETTDIGPAHQPWLRLHRVDSGDVLVIAHDGATRDGTPLLGNLAVVPWGTSALLRTATLRVEVVWHAGSEARVAESTARCRICFGAVAAGEPVVMCSCAALFHHECDAARINCPACGQLGAGAAT